MNRATAPMFAQLDRIGTEEAIFGPKIQQLGGLQEQVYQKIGRTIPEIDPKDVGKVNATLKDGAPAKVYLAEIAENPSRYQLTDQQEEWLKVAREVDTAPRQILQAHGQQVGEYQAKTTEHFVGRIMAGKYNENGELIESGAISVTDKRGLTGKATLSKERTFDSIEQAVAEGFVPEYSLAKTMMQRTRAAAREAVNIRVGGWMADHFREASRGNVPGLRIESGATKPGFGQPGEIGVLVNTENEGVQRRLYKLNGEEAQEDSRVREPDNLGARTERLPTGHSEGRRQDWSGAEVRGAERGCLCHRDSVGAGVVCPPHKILQAVCKGSSTGTQSHLQPTRDNQGESV